jgi:hypothetical protein
MAMWKLAIAGVTALAVAGTSLVYAQQAPRGDHMRRGASQEDVAAFTDARIAALKAGLRLTAEQEKSWPAFETALRDIAKARAERAAARGSNEPRPTDPIERLRRQAEMLTTAGAALKRLADAQEPLYTSLDDSQKHRFEMLAHLVGPRHMRFADGDRHERHHGGERNRQHHGPRGQGEGPGYRL